MTALPKSGSFAHEHLVIVHQPEALYKALTQWTDAPVFKAGIATVLRSLKGRDLPPMLLKIAGLYADLHAFSRAVLRTFEPGH